jgi:FkbM family methyltransferase
VSVRSTAERLTHRLVLRRRLPRPFQQGRIYTSSEAGLRYLKPRLTHVDPALLRLVELVVSPGAVVWDIGANVGLLSFAAALAAGPTGRVLAVEPDAWLVGLLRRSVSTNTGTAPVDVLPVAVSDEVGVGRFAIARRNRSTNYLEGYGTTQTGGVRQVDLVPTVTLDWLADHFPAPDVLKVDIEGAELLALAGGSGVLAGRPVLICEVAEENAAGVAELLRPLGYRFYDGDAATPATAEREHPPYLTLALPARP